MDTFPVRNFICGMIVSSTSHGDGVICFRGDGFVHMMTCDGVVVTESDDELRFKTPNGLDHVAFVDAQNEIGFGICCDVTNQVVTILQSKTLDFAFTDIQNTCLYNVDYLEDCIYNLKYNK